MTPDLWTTKGNVETLLEQINNQIKENNKMELSTKFDPTKQTESSFLKEDFLKTPSPEVITVYFGFGTALRYLREGKKVTRRYWSGYIELINSSFTKTISDLKFEDIKLQTIDLLATDWFVYDTK